MARYSKTIQMGVASYTLKTDSKNWLAFLEGQLTAEQLVDKEYAAPIAIEVQKEMTAIGQTVKDMFDKTALGWGSTKQSVPPVFEVNIKAQTTEPRNISLAVGATGAGAANWQRVNDGVVPNVKEWHPEKKKFKGDRRKTLMPMGVYVRRTSPGQGIPTSNVSGGYKRQPPRAFKKLVVSGIRARHFDTRIADYLRGDHDRSFSRRIQNALKRSIRRQGP